MRFQFHDPDLSAGPRSTDCKAAGFEPVTICWVNSIVAVIVFLRLCRAVELAGKRVRKCRWRLETI